MEQILFVVKLNMAAAVTGKVWRLLGERCGVERDIRMLLRCGVKHW
jgi:hypothetical protein